MKKLFILLVACYSFTFSLSAKEGMWMPQLLGSLNETEMRSMGMQISADDIYSVNHSSLKDAVLQFGSGCTGELISPQGLLVTNHHCGFSTIQSLSTIQTNYLENGFWAKNKKDELICPGLTVTFIKEIRDITSDFDQVLKPSMSEDERAVAMKSTSDSLEKKYSTKDYKAIIRVFYAGNKFYLFLTETFRDIRFVGAPPQSVGKFGGETDNWVWPRHTGDFSLFRIYANKENKPADYSPENVPFISIHHFPINIAGVKDGDFAMVFGFPGRTTEYALSSAVQLVKEQTNPVRIAIRDARLNVWRDAMNANDTIKLQYAAKFATVENAYKKWKGELQGFDRFNVVQSKVNAETAINDKAIRGLIQHYNDSTAAFKSISLAYDYYSEAFTAMEMINFSSRFNELNKLLAAEKTDQNLIDAAIGKLKNESKGFYKNYNREVDQQMTAVMLQLMDTALSATDKPNSFSKIHSDYSRFAKDLFAKSHFANEAKCNELLSMKPSKLKKAIQKDPAFELASQFAAKFTAVVSEYTGRNKQLTKIQRNYLSEMLQKMPEKVRYPDANSTLRVSYGKIASVHPRDGVTYDYFTTADGIVQKNATGNPDFEIDSILLQKIKKKDFGRYGNNGVLNTAFISSLHTTGGNSGSPVINAKGELVGINFDRIWEGVMSDYFYTEDICRNVALDVRYMLFVIDKVYNAPEIVNEMTIVK